MIDGHAIRLRWEADGSKRDERGKRVFAASEARAAGWGGVAGVAAITGLARSRIIRGLKDLDGPALEPGRIRRAGGGRHRITATDGTLLGELKRLVEPATMGDPMRPLTWVSKSREKLACELNAFGHDVSPNTVGRLLVDELAYSRQDNHKTLEGASHPDRNAQFEHINAQVIAAQSAGQPVISVDTKKKELIGNFKNGGTDYRPKGCPLDVNVHDFKDKELGKVVPHGIYDPTTNVGWVSVGITHDTAEFAVQSIRTWLDRIGRPRYTGMRELMITADCGGVQRGGPRAGEGGVAQARRRDRHADQGLPLSSRHIKMEQDRAPAVLPYHAELARQATRQPRRSGRVDRRDDHQNRAQGRVCAR